MDEDKLIDLANSDPNFVKVLKNISNIDELIMFMKTKNVLITNDEANKLLEALHYFTFDNKEKFDSARKENSLSGLDSKGEGKVSVGSSELDSVSGGVSNSDNPYLGILQRLF